MEASLNAVTSPAVAPRLRWLVISLPAYTLGWAAAQAMGEVVGEAWGGASLHLLGHTLGTVLLVGLPAGVAYGWQMIPRSLLLAYRAECSGG